jgi:hypothetical protein
VYIDDQYGKGLVEGERGVEDCAGMATLRSQYVA